MIPPTLKQQVYDQCLNLVDARIGGMQQKLADLRETAAAETKSTAGDKYETARAMLHIEQEQIGRQLAEALEQRKALTSLDLTLIPRKAIKGSLVITDRGLFFISTGLGKINVAGHPVVALSPNRRSGQSLSAARLGMSSG